MGTNLQTASVALCRLMAILLLIPLSLISSAQAINQPATVDQKVTIVSNNLTMAGFFKVIRKQTGLRVQYEPEVIFSEDKKLSVNFVQQPVSEVLNSVLINRGIVWKIQNNVILLKKQNASTSTHPTISAASDTLINTVIPFVSGKVTDAAGTPLSKVTVQVKDSQIGTTTNNNGEFTLADVKMGVSLLISYIGYQTREVPVLGKSIMVPLQIKVSELDEAIVQAYGTTTRRLATGSIGTVTAEEIARQPVINPLQALQGRIPGMVVTQTNGYASSPFKVEIRGRNSINNKFTGEPLYIIDDVPMTILDFGFANNSSTGLNVQQSGILNAAGGQSPFVSLNPADIESISVLKDADATAIYGSRGANGVVLITTKRGKPGKTKYDINVYTGVSKITRFQKMLDGKEYITVRKEAFYNDSIAYGITPNAGNAPDLLVWDTSRFTNWQKFLLGGQGKTLDAQLSISGGDKLTTFRVGAGYHRQTDVLTKRGSDQRASVQFNFLHKTLKNRLSFSLTSLYTYYTNNLVGVGGSIILSPNAPPAFNSEGKLNYAGWEPVSQYFPFASLLEQSSSKTGLLNSNLGVKYEIVNGLEISANIGYSTTNATQSYIKPIASQNPRDNPFGSNVFGSTNIRRVITEPQIEYKRFISKGQLTVLFGASIQNVSQDGATISGSGIINDNLLHSVSNAPVTTSLDNVAQYKYAATFGRINYNWQNKYIINLSARRDGSSKFGKGNQYGNFGAAGIAWIFTEENWFKNNLKVLSFGKLRSSYGVTGSDNIGDYQYLTRWSASDIPTYQGSSGNVPTQHANPNYQWESNRKMEAALSLGFWKDRHNIEIAWYRNRSSNQLIDYPLPGVTGFLIVTANRPATVQNSGLEVKLNGTVLDHKDFNWNYNFNIGINRNKLIAFEGIEKTSFYGNIIVGQPLSLTRLLHFTGVDRNSGQYTYEDKNKDGTLVIDPGPNSDLYYKDLSTRFDGGFGTDLNYKGWELHVFFHFRKKTAFSPVYSGVAPGGMINQSVEVLDRWQKVGDNAKFARYTTAPTLYDNLITLSDANLVDASFVRLQNLSVSYNLTQIPLNKLHLSTCRIYLQGENLLLFTNYKGADPAVPAFGTIPPYRNYTLGIQFSF